MQLTDYHSKYYAYELTKRCPPDSSEKLAGALFDAQVDLNPHQIDAALFAFQSPLSKALEGQRNEKRRSLFDAQDQVDKQRDELIANIEGKLTQKVISQGLFILRWLLK